MKQIKQKIKTFFYKLYLEKNLRKKYEKKKVRFLEIGPGNERIEGFETINIVKTPVTDYVADVQKGIPFKDETFDLIYTSHFLEHVVWYKVQDVLDDFYRALKVGGRVEIWVPDGLKIAKAFVDGEINGSSDFEKDGWYRFNDEKDICKWVNGRIFSYGDGKGTKGHWNFHVGLFSERYLTSILQKAGFKNVKRLVREECRGYDHGWINLGISAEK